MVRISDSHNNSGIDSHADGKSDLNDRNDGNFARDSLDVSRNRPLVKPLHKMIGPLRRLRGRSILKARIRFFMYHVAGSVP